MTLSQRALWTFLFFTLIGPFLAGICAALAVPFAIWANVPPYVAADHAAFDMRNMPDLRGVMQLMAQAAVNGFIWTPIAAGVAGLGSAALLLWRGTLSRSIAGGMGVVGFFVGYVLAPFEAGEFLVGYALFAGIVGSVLAVFLRSIGILQVPDQPGS